MSGSHATQIKNDGFKGMRLWMNEEPVRTTALSFATFQACFSHALYGDALSFARLDLPPRLFELDTSTVHLHVGVSLDVGRSVEDTDCLVDSQWKVGFLGGFGRRVGRAGGWGRELKEQRRIGLGGELEN